MLLLRIDPCHIQDRGGTARLTGQDGSLAAQQRGATDQQRQDEERGSSHGALHGYLGVLDWVIPLRPLSRSPLLPFVLSLRPLVLSLGLHSGPAVLEGDGAVEDGRPILRVPVAAEVALALELETVTGLGPGEARLELAAREGHEGFGVEVGLVVLALGVLLGVSAR